MDDSTAAAPNVETTSGAGEPAGTPRLKPGMTFHPRSPDASIERLRALAGIFALNVPVPSSRLWDDVCDEVSEYDAGS
ncbi:MAG: hypothetical protein ACYDCQ_14590 [Dehalococcoidia bacterium]